MQPFPSHEVARRGTLRHPIITLAAILVALSAILGACLAGTTPSADGSASPSVSSAATPDSAPSHEPTSPATPDPTPAPTPIAQWTGLTWSDPVTPPFFVHLYDLLPWGDGYVAVGEVPGQGPYASFTSPDGLNWTIEQRDFPGAPRHLVALGDELLAFMPEAWPDNSSPPSSAIGGPPTSVIWHSSDGVIWTSVDSPSWQDAWHEAVPQSVSSTYPDGWDQTQHDLPLGVVDVARGPGGLVAIGNSFGDNSLEPIILHSTDGRSWIAASLPAGSDSALLNTVADHDGRFIITGATGVWTDPATARAAAWYSDDGLTWVQAAVESAEYAQDAGTELGPLWAGDDGLLACRGNRGMSAGGWRYMMEWLSSDGAAWQVAPNIDQSPGCDWSASDGTRIVSLGPRAHASPVEWPGVTGAWTSTDGEHWQPLTLSSTVTDTLERFWVVPDGVIYAGAQSFWFGTAQVAE